MQTMKKLQSLDMVISPCCLNYDLLVEILSNCSLKSVDRLKIISKIFNQIAHDAAFMQNHTKKTGTVYGYIIQSLHNSDYYYNFVSPLDLGNQGPAVAFDFLPPKSKILASSNQGIVCFINQEGEYGISKLTTRQTRIIPHTSRYMRKHCPKDRVVLAVLQSNPLCYKIMRLFKLKNRLPNNVYLCEIFDSKRWTWKRLEISLPVPLLKKHKHNSVLANGRFHWLLTRKQILAFDLETETHTIIHLPTLDAEEYYGAVQIVLIKYEGKLGLICEDLECFEIWVMEDYKNGIWKKINRIYTEAAKKKEQTCVLPAVDIYNSEIALMKGRTDLFFYNYKDSSIRVAKLDRVRVAELDRRVRVAELDHHVTYPFEVFSFRSDLELVDLGLVDI